MTCFSRRPLTFQSWTGCISHDFLLPFLPLGAPLSSLPTYPLPLSLNTLRIGPPSPSCTLSPSLQDLAPHRSPTSYDHLLVLWDLNPPAFLVCPGLPHEALSVLSSLPSSIFYTERLPTILHGWHLLVTRSHSP